MVVAGSRARAQSADPDLIFRKSTTFKLLTPNDKLAVYGIDDPVVEGVACHYTAPEKGGLAGAFGLAEQTSDISLACRQYGPIKFKGKFEQGEVVFSERRSLFFKKMQIVRGCDVKRNILVYMTYTDKLIDGSPKNSTSTVPIEPWGGAGRHAEMRRLSALSVRPRSVAAGDDIGSRRSPAPSARGRSDSAAPRPSAAHQASATTWPHSPPSPRHSCNP